MIVFNPDDAERTAAEGVPVILVRRDTTAEDIHGMKTAGINLTELGGMASHVAVQGTTRPRRISITWIFSLLFLKPSKN